MFGNIPKINRDIGMDMPPIVEMAGIGSLEMRLQPANSTDNSRDDAVPYELGAHEDTFFCEVNHSCALTTVRISRKPMYRELFRAKTP